MEENKRTSGQRARSCLRLVDAVISIVICLKSTSQGVADGNSGAALMSSDGSEEGDEKMPIKRSLNSAAPMMPAL